MAHHTPILLGAHMSVTGGYYKALERGNTIGCTAIQIFTKSNRQWYAKAITPQESERFKEVQNSLDIQVIAHASYLINIGSDSTSTVERSIEALIEELERCDQLAIPYLVLHPGSGTDRKQCLEKIITNLDTVLTHYHGPTMILLENTAGQGNTIGNSFEELASIRTALKHKKSVGFCFDTCHAFSTGYDFRDYTSYTAMWQQYDTILGLEHLKAIHINDSKKGLGAKIDRHEHIGQGKIGSEAFKLLINDKQLAKIPKILETPKDSIEDDIQNMQRLLSWYTKKE